MKRLAEVFHGNAFRELIVVRWGEKGGKRKTKTQKTHAKVKVEGS
jgi:hypothetical protein